MKKLLLPLIILIGVAASVAGMSLIRLSKSMEDWEMSFDEETEEK
jgi:hypothetical protein